MIEDDESLEWDDNENPCKEPVLEIKYNASSSSTYWMENDTLIKDYGFENLIEACSIRAQINPLVGIRNDAQYRELDFVHDLQKIANRHKSYCGQAYTLDQIKKLINMCDEKDIVKHGDGLHALEMKRDALSERIQEFENLDEQMRQHNLRKLK